MDVYLDIVLPFLMSKTFVIVGSVDEPMQIESSKRRIAVPWAYIPIPSVTMDAPYHNTDHRTPQMKHASRKIVWENSKIILRYSLWSI